MDCSFCGASLPTQARFCPMCGKSAEEKEKPVQRRKTRGNGQGTVYKRGNAYVAVKTLGYYLDETGKRHRRTVSKYFRRKKDAVEALPNMGTAAKQEKKTVTMRDVYNKWLPTLTVSKDTVNCYKAAWKYFAPIHDLFTFEVDIDDLQECLDDCPKGKRTKENMKACIGLVYKYGVPRGYFPEKLLLGQFLRVSGTGGVGGVGLPAEYLQKIESAVGTIPGADLITAQCYLGFRPSEFLSLTHKSYNAVERAFVGGAKTEAGKDRTVTVTPKIQGIVDSYAKKESEQFFCGPDCAQLSAADYRDLFYSVLDALDLENPLYEISGIKKHTYTPHSCRHVFADLMKKAKGADKDKLSLIGHTSPEMLRYYQDAPLEDLRKITDQF